MNARDFVAQLLASMQPAIERCARRVRHEDLFGEVGLAWAGLLYHGRIDNANAERITWGIVRNLVRCFHRRESYRRHSPLPPQGLTSRDREPLTVLLERERHHAVTDAVNSLAIEDREVIRHRHDQGKSLALRARSKGTCASSERSRYRRALQQLRRHPRVAALIED